MSALIETGTDAIFQLGLRLTRAEAEQVFQAALSAIEASGTHAVCPQRPTQEMVDAGMNVDRGAFGRGVVRCVEHYRAMLSARPPLTEREGKE